MLLSVTLTVCGNAAKTDNGGPRVIVDPKTTQNPVYAPLPDYPKEARVHGWGGWALYEVHCQFNGTAPYVFTRISTGHQVLDEAGEAALKQWRWRGGRFRLLAIMMTFNPGKAEASPSARKSEEKAKDFVTEGKTNLLHAPSPPYPLRARKEHMTGKGLFELRFNSDGSVSSVLVTKSTGYDLLDEECKVTFAKWRCKPGAYSRMTVPISFGMEAKKH